jgi:hypothetical protein
MRKIGSVQFFSDELCSSCLVVRNQRLQQSTPSFDRRVVIANYLPRIPWYFLNARVNRGGSDVICKLRKKATGAIALSVGDVKLLINGCIEKR